MISFESGPFSWRLLLKATQLTEGWSSFKGNLDDWSLISKVIYLPEGPLMEAAQLAEWWFRFKNRWANWRSILKVSLDEVAWVEAGSILKAA